MKLALFLLPKAEEDIDSHCSFLAKTSLEMALKFDEAVFASCDRLREMPFVGSERKCANPKLSEIRIWFVKGFEKYNI
jgi:plasmid stabilization system protein ParE